MPLQVVPHRRMLVRAWYLYASIGHSGIEVCVCACARARVCVCVTCADTSSGYTKPLSTVGHTSVTWPDSSLDTCTHTHTQHTHTHTHTCAAVHSALLLCTTVHYCVLLSTTVYCALLCTTTVCCYLACCYVVWLYLTLYARRLASSVTTGSSKALPITRFTE